MADVADANTKYDRSSEGEAHNQIDRPGVLATLTTDTEKCNCDTCFDESTANSIEELGDKEQLFESLVHLHQKI